VNIPTAKILKNMAIISPRPGRFSHCGEIENLKADAQDHARWRVFVITMHFRMYPLNRVFEGFYTTHI